MSDIEKYNQLFARRKGIGLDVTYGPMPLVASFDPERIRQVINNLLARIIHERDSDVAVRYRRRRDRHG